MNIKNNPKFERNPTLDGWRGVCILWVVLFHLNDVYMAKDFYVGKPLLSKFLWNFFSAGFLGVDYFFVLSGFLISGVLLPHLEKGVDVKRFYTRRFFKIFPQYFLLILFCFLVMLLLFPASFGKTDFLVHTFFLQNYIKELPMLNHTWSLCVEEHYYVFYPLLLVIVLKISRKFSSPKKVLNYFLFSLIIVFNLIRWFSSPFLPGLQQMTHIRVDAILFGCLLKLFEPFLKNIFTNRITWIFFLFNCLIIVGFGMRSLNYHDWYPYPLVYFFAGGLMMGIYFTNTFLTKILIKTPFLVSIGRNSYGIYIWHIPILVLLTPHFVQKQNNFGWAFLYLFGSLLLGILSTEVVEKYSLRVRDKIAPSQRLVTAKNSSTPLFPEREYEVVS